MKGNKRVSNKGSRISIIRVSNKRVNKGSNRRVSKGTVDKGVLILSSNISGVNNTIII
ncbi:hypothetical protein CWI38_1599p0030 [Hamiltosporidium tvaerminnensis]|uniref:Uncharacterized protein n=1 Tax=Hamiltosporidium tvaerminnensis TaxID=1176355 RepID=A0A4Q9LSK2_9MICR|nr:hypothetical protein CWI38_1599p0030 [Hamiltosporidium tvaerminnensis]